MRRLPNPPRTEGFSDPEAVINAMRRWFWALAAYDFDFTDPYRWTRDDNRQAQTYHFQIVAVRGPTGEMRSVLIPLRQGFSVSDIEARIVRLAPYDPLCAKALGVITANKLKGSKE